MRFFCRLIATGFYSGFFPVAPGTVGSLIAIVLFWFFPISNTIFFILCIGLVFIVGVWTASEVEKDYGHDASVINVDEMVGMWLSVLFFPVPMGWKWLLAAFFIFRLFDIVKPFPVGISQKLPKGWGIMVDDVIAGLYANLTLRFIQWIFLKV